MVIYGNPGSGRVYNTIQPRAGNDHPARVKRASGRKRSVIVDGQRYGSITEAAIACGIKPKTLEAAVRRRRTTCKGHSICHEV